MVTDYDGPLVARLHAVGEEVGSIKDEFFDSFGIFQGEGEGDVAAVREAEEELGLTLVPDDLRHALTVCFPQGHDELYLCSLSLSAPAFRLQPEEVAEVRWASEDEILLLRREGLFTPFRPDYLRLLFRLWEHGDVMEPDPF